MLEDRPRPCRDALVVERARREAAPEERIVRDREAGFQHLLAHLVAQEAGLAGDGSAVDRAGDMADETAGNAWIENHGEVLARRNLARIDPLDHTLAGTAADLFAEPRHPYTRALMEAVPHITGDGIPEIDEESATFSAPMVVHEGCAEPGASA